VKLLILRAEPGASETAARARAMGLDPVVAPLFEIRGIAAPVTDSSPYEAVLLTSANGARHAPAGLTGLPCFAVGDGTATAARSAGFADVRTGPSDGGAAAAMMAEAGVRRALHVCGSDRAPFTESGVAIDRCVVYVAEPLPWQPLDGAGVAMIHSPRAGSRFADLVKARSRIAIAAISAAAAAAAGEGWAAKVVAAAPRDAALLELAAELCKYDPEAAKDDGDGL
jgi:uroporphyrinogen-III synthase